MSSFDHNAAPLSPGSRWIGRRASIVPLGFTLSSMFLLTYAICIGLGLVSSAPPMHQILSFVFPGFAWLSWGSVLVGIVYSVVYGWYIAVSFTIFYGWFHRWLS